MMNENIKYETRNKKEYENEINKLSQINLQEAKIQTKIIEDKYRERLLINAEIGRKIVSFQGNKREPIFNWFKYREGFSKSLVDYIIKKENMKISGRIFDPFGGAGTTGFVACEQGMDAIICELLPVGSFFIQARETIRNVSAEIVQDWCKEAIENKPWKDFPATIPFSHIRITEGAFSEETTNNISIYRTWIQTLEESKRRFFDFVLFSILEEISYTRKDGQYLRWDQRSPRTKAKFSKGIILSFNDAIDRKLSRIFHEVEHFNIAPSDLFSESDIKEKKEGSLTLLSGSVFDQIYNIDEDSLDAIITSPPYCNRYDYTRTYALELAYLGTSEEHIRFLRQALLSCTVENKKKDFKGVEEVDLKAGTRAFEENKTIKSVLEYLQKEAELGLLNNKGIVRMVSGYFFDMSIHIAQVSRRMKAGAKYVMVNDNVRYNGLAIPIDCILSELAEDLGFKCKAIWVLPKGKGNSSQQMKKHGREELRKCVYVWEKLNLTV